MGDIDKKKKNIYCIILVTIIFTVTSGVGYIFDSISFPDTNIVVIYLLAVLLATWLTDSLVFGLLASIFATFLFNYFFAAPKYSLSVNDPNYIITFITMTITALITSTLTSHSKQSALAAQKKEAETQAIYKLTNRLTDASDIDSIASCAVTAISNLFTAKVACLLFDDLGNPEDTFIQQSTSEKQIRREVHDVNDIKYRIECLQTAYSAGEEFYDFPIYGREYILGIIRIPKEKAQLLDASQSRLLHAVIESTALAMDRFRAVEERIKSREEAIKERYRANLLRAISHDLRTPLTSMIGNCEMLLDMTDKMDNRYAMVRSLQKDAYWLQSFVENVLSLTRLEDDQLALEKQPEAVEEIIGEAVNHVLKQSPECEIQVQVPDELLIVPMSAKLIMQVIINLLDNAIKHSESKKGIDVFARLTEDKRAVEFKVRDRGKGIRDSDLPHVFQMYYTTSNKHSDAAPGIGLGLAICDSIIKAHNGCITANNRNDGPGAEFVFYLPMEDISHVQ